MEIRTARTGDAHGIADVHVRGWREAYRHILPERLLASLSVAEREASWTTRLAAAATSSRTLVADHDGTVAGWLSFGSCRDDDAEPGSAEIYGIYVDPDQWTRGIGTALMDDAVATLAAQGVRKLTLWVFEANVSARRFYESRGFALEPGITKLFERDGATASEVRYRREIAANV